jgi:hypothetical protein
MTDPLARADQDYGCAQGQLSEKLNQTLPKATVVSCDANAAVFGWRVFRKNRAIQTVLCNLLYPPIGKCMCECECERVREISSLELCLIAQHQAMASTR